MPLPHCCLERHNIMRYHPHKPPPFKVARYFYICYHFLYLQGLANILLSQLVDNLYHYYYPHVHNWLRRLLSGLEWSWLWEVFHYVSKFPIFKESTTTIWSTAHDMHNTLTSWKIIKLSPWYAQVTPLLKTSACRLRSKPRGKWCRLKFNSQLYFFSQCLSETCKWRGVCETNSLNSMIIKWKK